MQTQSQEQNHPLPKKLIATIHCVPTLCFKQYRNIEYRKINWENMVVKKEDNKEKLLSGRPPGLIQ